MKTVYLCGPINGCSDSEANDWRAHASELLGDGWRVLDPMCRDFRGMESGNCQEIVRGDLADIVACDAVLAMCLRPSWGTAMEIRFAAAEARIPVVAVAAAPVSPWLEAHAHVVPDLAAAVDWLNTPS